MPNPPKIHTLRNDGAVPRTSDCFTPRTMTGTDGAFKDPEYGSFISGPHRSPMRFLSRSMRFASWLLAIGVVVMLAVSAFG